MPDNMLGTGSATVKDGRQKIFVLVIWWDKCTLVQKPENRIPLKQDLAVVGELGKCFFLTLNYLSFLMLPHHSDLPKINGLYFKFLI